jgi:hypothetical protein
MRPVPRPLPPRPHTQMLDAEHAAGHKFGGAPPYDRTHVTASTQVGWLHGAGGVRPAACANGGPCACCRPRATLPPRPRPLRQGRGAEAVHSKASIMAGNRDQTSKGASDQKGR